MTLLRRSRCRAPGSKEREREGKYFNSGAYQDNAIYLKTKVDRIQKHDDCGYHNFAHGDNDLPIVKINVVAVREEVERAVRRGACSSKSNEKDCKNGEGNTDPVCQKWICSGVSEVKIERLEVQCNIRQEKQRRRDESACIHRSRRTRQAPAP